jgi:hypothetical protein
MTGAMSLRSGRGARLPVAPSIPCQAAQNGPKNECDDEPHSRVASVHPADTLRWPAFPFHSAERSSIRLSQKRLLMIG